MKPVITSLFCSSLLCALPLAAQDATFDPLGTQAEAEKPKHVRIQVEFIELSLEEMSDLMASPAAKKGDAALRVRLSELIKAKKAQLIETQIVTARSGERAVTESVQELIYPTEYEPSEFIDASKLKPETAKILRESGFASGPTPTAFDTRNLGSILEVEPVFAETNTFIDLRLSSEIVYHTKNETWRTWKDSFGEANVTTPTIYKLGLNLGLTVQAGKPSLLGAVSPKDEQGKVDLSCKLLVFTQADVITLGN